ncbi:MAG: DUF1989 domain-containing protein [Pseudomonadota bacterium]
MTVDMQDVIKVREPGLGANWLGRERYSVRGMGVIAVPLFAGDMVEVQDPEGLQPAAIAAFNSRGDSCTQQLGLTVNSRGDSLLRALSAGSDMTARLKRKLDQFNVDVANLDVAKELQGDTPAGASIHFTAEADLICLLSAPGNAMLAHEQNPATEILVFITRINPTDTVHSDVPDPLADPLQDFRIKAATAQAYEVKAGEYIQVLDIDGRQCSDFQCFELGKLDKGIEHCLDATATRTMMGSAYPGPGLYAKFYNADLEPLVEVIQDTCGRHDSFGLACTRKYYEDMGYPGHANCSDNFNNALQDYPVAPRGGWMAMNLFFNTFFDDSYQLFFDEPWSRPGDYVLMRALRDMVCLTSSCACDIDAANAWNPTDIQLRVYKENESFKRAIAFRKTTDADPVMTQETGFHPETSKLTRNFTEYNGYWLANNYTNQGAIDEYWVCRKDVVMIDLSPLRKYEVIGPDAEDLMQLCVTRDMKKLAVGQVVYTAMCNVSGGMIDDGTVYRLGQDNFRWIGGCDGSGIWLRERAAEHGLKVWVRNSTDQLHNIQVQGPKSRCVLEKCIWTRPDQASVSELEWFRMSVARLNDDLGIPLVVSRTGYTGELGYEVFCHPKDAPEVWRTIQDAGQEEGIKPMGLEALDMLRIEAGLIFAGYEFCEQTDPFEAGIPFTVPLKTKTDDFIGKEALLKRKESPQRKLVGLELNGKELAGQGDGVFSGRYQIGEITSGTMSPILGKNIALCRLNVEFADLNTEIEIGKLDGQQKRIPARVVRFPHFDPTKERVRGNYES